MGATRYGNIIICQGIFQSTLPARGSDQYTSIPLHWQSYFNPRSPRGGATRRPYQARFCRCISIHAPREGERRQTLRLPRARRRHFNPRSPRGGATIRQTSAAQGAQIFQSTLPARGSDVAGNSESISFSSFQSTLPARGSDEKVPLAACSVPVFQSTLPARGSDCMRGERAVYGHRFQSTLPARGSDQSVPSPLLCRRGISIHAPREGERLDLSTYPVMQYDFNPRSPRGGATPHCACQPDN